MLRFYDSKDKRDYDRNNGHLPVLMPRTRLVPFQCVRTHAADDFVQQVRLLDENDNATDITSYFHVSLTANYLSSWNNGAGVTAYDTLTTSGDDITSGVLNPADTEITLAYTNTITRAALKSGDLVYVECSLTLNSGTAPNMYVASSADATSPASNSVVLSSGTNKLTFRVTSDLSSWFIVITTDIGDVTNFALTMTKAVMTTLPYPIEKTSKDYITNIARHPLNSLLPIGVYSLEITDNLGVYYSDYFCISDIMPNIVTTWTNDGSNGYDSHNYINSENRALALIELSGGNGQSNSSTFAVRQDEKIYVSGMLNRTSGQRPTIHLYDNSDDSLIDTITLSYDGDFYEYLTSDRNCTAYVKISVTANAHFNISPITVHRAYGSFINIYFTNSRDVRDVAGKQDLLYSRVTESEVFLDTQLNHPEHETSEIGTEKDGVFISQKLISTPKQKIIAYCSRCVYESLMTLPLHDTITITDEVGNEYSVDAGNIVVDFTYDYYEAGSLEITFTETSFYWTENIDNVT